ncbi:MAG: nucleoside-diphosphate sugar epimerase/dehydratase [Kiritimatiellae bacterium]|nr:nucleoside-diphosphate sugar epimerase/dehydratase [Kiritimatiellia bacterium]MDD4340773.1 nucleoside-diphosphate sugar epimerase/dehydratase [Kiritimatiellia bacterium]
MLQQFKNRNFYIILVGDVVLFAASLILAYGLRFSLEIPGSEWRQIVLLLPWLLIIKVAVFYAMGVYRGMWRYTSVPDAIRLTKASIIATLAIMTALTLVHQFKGFSRSVFLADCIFTVFFCSGSRLIIRVLSTKKRGGLKFWDREDEDSLPVRHVRLLIIGAGDAAASIIREIQGNPHSPYDVVACIDDDLRKHGQTLLEVPVRAPIERLLFYVNRFQVDEILIAMPSVVGETMRQIVSACKASGLPFKTLPSLGSLVDGKVTVNDVRNVEYEDILGRSPVQLDHAGIGRCLTGKTVAVTGAGGSIGSELCRQILRFNPAVLVLIESSEFNLHQIEQELRRESRFEGLRTVLGRVQDRVLMANVFDRYRPQVVFHAAACKHVPIVELNRREGILNNVLGSLTLMDVAEEYGVERFVQVSTDKAVRPTNVMGASKRVVEMALQARVPGKTRFMAVRFGNVLGSSGSVIPLFQRQIQTGGPVTVTHPDITRYFMMIPEACQLILQAGAMGEGGEIFILEMGTPVKIADMARDMIRLSGKVPEQDIQIVYTGLRPGEKLHEELITQGEGIVATAHEKIMVLRRDGPAATDADSDRRIRAQIDRLVQTADTFDAGQVKDTLQDIVPEYLPELPAAGS